MTSRRRQGRWERRLPTVLYALAGGLGVAALGLGVWALSIGRRYDDQLARAARVQAEVLARDFAEAFRLATDSSVSRIFAPFVADPRWDGKVLDRLAESLREAEACACAPVAPVAGGLFAWHSREPDRVHFRGDDPARGAALRATLARAAAGLRSDGVHAFQLKVDDHGTEITAPTLAVRRDGHSFVVGYLADPNAFARALFLPIVERVQQARVGDRAAQLVAWRFLAPGGATTLGVGEYVATDPSVSIAFFRAPYRTDGGEPGANFLAPAISPTVANAVDQLNWVTDPRSTPYRMVVQVHPRAMGEYLYGMSAGPAWPIVAALVVILVLAGATLALARRFVRQLRERVAFATAVAHDLRTPLTQILLYAESLQLDRPAVRTREEAAGVIVRETRRLIHLVENALRFVRVGTARPLLSESTFPLGEFIHETVDGLRPLLERDAVRIEVAVTGRPIVQVDREALEQVVRNVLDNAIRFGPKGQTITVTARQDASGSSLVVDDQGPGVPIGMRRRVFEPFVQGGSSPGTGIGLSVSLQLMTLMHGSIRIESAPSGGARVILHFPASAAATVAGVAGALSPGHAQ